MPKVLKCLGLQDEDEDVELFIEKLLLLAKYEFNLRTKPDSKRLCRWMPVTSGKQQI